MNNKLKSQNVKKKHYAKNASSQLLFLIPIIPYSWCVLQCERPKYIDNTVSRSYYYPYFSITRVEGTINRQRISIIYSQTGDIHQIFRDSGYPLYIHRHRISIIYSQTSDIHYIINRQRISIIYSQTVDIRYIFIDSGYPSYIHRQGISIIYSQTVDIHQIFIDSSYPLYIHRQ